MSASLAVLSVLAVIVALVATQAFSLFHITPPRHVTVSVRLGKVLETVTGPGLSWKTPLTSSWDMLVEEQVDSVQMVECGTKDGITLVFPRIDVHNILPRSKAREMFLRFGHDYDQLTIFKNVKFFTGQICATMTAEEVFLTQFNQLDEQLQELLVKYQTEKVTGIDITKVKFYKPQARNSNILIEFQKRAESEAERQALVAANERIAQENANMIKAAKGQNDLVTAKELAVLQRDLEAKKNEKEKQAIDLLMKKEAAEARAKVIEIEAAAEASRIRLIGKAKADALLGEAEANEKLLTAAYLQKHQQESISQNAKLIIGNDIPKLGFMQADSLWGKK
eukprot:g2812.t1